LGELFHKPIGEGNDYAESWELVDRGEDQSAVAAGPLAGTTLHELVTARGAELLGRHAPHPRFPLLIKLLDAQRALSVQVHPNNEQAAKLTPPDLGKTEVWYVLDAQPGSRIYAGLKRGFDRRAFERELNRGTCELCLHSFEPQTGDVVFLPAGTVHALGAGLLVAEIQQSSDVTYRLFDWNRVGSDDRPRPLHIAAGLDVTDFARGPVEPLRLQPPVPGEPQLLASCTYFDLRKFVFKSPLTIDNNGICRVWMVIEGELNVTGDHTATPLKPGETLLIPASWERIEATPAGRSTVLEATLG